MSSLPLLYHTPQRWAAFVLQEPFVLLSDHAYLERKAASNALELLNRWPEPNRPEAWVATISAIARDEAQHLHQVTQLIERRGGKLDRLHRSQYAGDLRKLVRQGKGPQEIMDRLLVSALIEARSCERFELLSKESGDKELQRFYKGLCASEHGHFTVFHRLAEQTINKKECATRWKYMLEEEARIIQAQPVGHHLHSGFTS